LVILTGKKVINQVDVSHALVGFPERGVTAEILKDQVDIPASSVTLGVVPCSGSVPSRKGIASEK